MLVEEVNKEILRCQTWSKASRNHWWLAWLYREGKFRRTHQPDDPHCLHDDAIWMSKQEVPNIFDLPPPTSDLFPRCLACNHKCARANLNVYKQCIWMYLKKSWSSLSNITVHGDIENRLFDDDQPSKVTGRYDPKKWFSSVFEISWLPTGHICS